MRAEGLLAVLFLVGAAGCAGPPAAAPPADPFQDRMRVAGLVESETLIPLANATVAIVELNLTARTDALGSFAFPPLEPRAYRVEAWHPGYRPLTLVARPETNSASLDFVLQRALPPAPRQEQFRFRGILECGYVTPAAAGACDADAGLAGNQTRFGFPLGPGWRTAVVDVVFDSGANPGLGGLVLLVRGDGGAAGPGGQDLGRFNGSRPFTARLEPNAAHPGGAAPVDGNLTGFRLEVQPQGRLGGQACPPVQRSTPCARGVGAGINIEFDLFVTAFYVVPAPPGFTLRSDA
ncbi:MAG TPA: carboxypeptidase-like regulatory domain-containing protein [Candidatus Thermoplasmatota archaeon]|nr:carboxypeptidase-like regulatory domain-containing protein [Candidatus Thermoplasmatota archaeon]